VGPWRRRGRAEQGVLEEVLQVVVAACHEVGGGEVAKFRAGGLLQRVARCRGRSNSLASASLSCSVVFSISSAASCIGPMLTPPCSRTFAVISSRRSRVRGASGTSRRSVQRGSVDRP